MYTKLFAVGMSFLTMATLASAQDVSVEKGARIAKIGGCHDCHTPGYSEANGVLDPAVALIGSPVGYQGPWGTTYAVNLRIEAAKYSETQFIDYLKHFETMPPMPWFNVHELDESEIRSLHQYILSLGAPGDPAPTYVPPGVKPTTPYIVFVPVMPAG
ncbi:c-type cytochrome [Devosia sp. 2618]|uniref:c-type cytochrome n=1 Tax=Devosia sp. 2618 TaxID=3156454 RepID=UPI0033976481